MGTIAQIHEAMQETLGKEAEKIAKETGFVQRKSKMNGGLFVQTMVYGVMGNPGISYTQLSQSAGMVGVVISPQGLEQRFTPEAAELMHRVLQQVVKQAVSGSPTQIALLQRFNGVYLRDSCVVSLPKELNKEWPGVGSHQGKSAGLKLHVGINYNTGELQGPTVTNGRTHDQKSPYHEEIVPAGGLRIADLGFFDLDQFSKDQSEHVYFLSRYKVGTVVLDQQGQRIDLVKRLENVEQLDCSILLGQNRRVPCRLLAHRVPQEVADQRRRKLHEYAVRKQAHLTQETLALAQWTLMITNVPQELLSLKEALILYKVRWQIELLFKLWKQYAKIDEWRSQNPYRILCELFAKLIAVLIMHWNFILSFWAIPARSLFKAVQIFQSFASCLAISFNDAPLFLQVLETIQHALRAGCLLNSRRTKSNTYQSLLEGLA